MTATPAPPNTAPSAEAPAAAPAPVIEVARLTAHYGETQVLFDVDLAVDAGEIMVIMGGSGSGKSTFLRHLIGLQDPSGGSVRVLGKSWAEVGLRENPELRRP